MYVIQKRHLGTNPYPEDFNDKTANDESPPAKGHDLKYIEQDPSSLSNYGRVTKNNGSI